MNQWIRGAVLLGATLLGSCGGSGEGLDENGRPGTGNGGALTPDLQSIQDHVFTPICTACHTGAAAPLGFRLDEDSAFAMLVNTPSVEVPSLKRVLPGQPDSSYLIQKLEGHAAVGGQMPLGQTPLPQATIDVIRQWIANGAAPAAAAANASTFTRLQVVVPMEDELFTRADGDPLIAADGELDLGSIDAQSLRLERSTSGTFGDGSETLVTDAKVDVRSSAPTVLAVVLPASERVPGNYRLTIRGTGPAPVRDRMGRPISGTAEGASASDFVLQYTIEDLP
ncbi:MAG: hypothetical protein WDO56_29015 [Gammaproteobacteria bacterium]